MTARKKLAAVVAAGVLTVGGGLGGMIAFLSPYQGPDTAATVPAAASGVNINGATGASNGSANGTGITGINLNSLTGSGSAQGTTQGKQATTQGKQSTAAQNNGTNGKATTTQRAGNGGG